MNRYISECNFLMECDLFYTGPADYGLGSEKIFHPTKMFENCVIYLHLYFFKSFVEIMKHNKFKYKIVSGFSDYLVPYISEPNRDYTADWLLFDENLIGWFCVNKQIEHPKLISIPIGVPRSLPDPAKGNEQYGEFMEWTQSLSTHMHIINVIDYIKSGRTIIDEMRSKKTSDNLIYVRYTIQNTDKISDKHCPSNQTHNNFRRELSVYLHSQTNFKQENLTHWTENIFSLFRYKYCLCPHGRGPDTFRTWESLLVGTVPIVFSSCLDELYKDLPVLVIDSFEQINEKYLNEQYDIIVDRDNYKFEKLYLNYWMDMIKK
jgi:hypothetical protein